MSSTCSCTHLPLSPGTAAIQMILAEHTAMQASTMGSSLMFNRQTWREQKRELVSFKLRGESSRESGWELFNELHLNGPTKEQTHSYCNCCSFLLVKKFFFYILNCSSTELLTIVGDPHTLGCEMLQQELALKRVDWFNTT